MGDCGVGQRCGRACCAGCGDCELSRSAVHAEEWDTGNQAASEDLIGSEGWRRISAYPLVPETYFFSIRWEIAIARLYRSVDVISACIASFWRAA